MFSGLRYAKERYIWNLVSMFAAQGEGEIEALWAFGGKTNNPKSIKKKPTAMFLDSNPFVSIVITSVMRLMVVKGCGKLSTFCLSCPKSHTCEPETGDYAFPSINNLSQIRVVDLNIVLEPRFVLSSKS